MRRLLRVDDPGHRTALLLLPWWVSASLDADENRMVGEHVAECARCRREVEDICALRDSDARLAPVPDAELAWRRLQPLLHPQRSRWRALAALRDAFRDWPLSLRGAFAVQWAVIAALGFVVATATLQHPAAYRTLAGAAMPMRVEGNAVVVFVPGTSEAEMRAILRASGARVVDGPLQSGAWVIALPDIGFATAIRRMRMQRGVKMVEPLRVTGHR